MTINRWRNVLPLLVVVVAVGCGGNGVEPPKTVPAGGSVLLKGKPAAGVTVTFHPQFDTGTIKWQPIAVTDKGGKFTLRTGPGGNGAMPGEYKVTFELLRVESDRKNGGIEVEVDAWKGKYANMDTAPRVTVGPSAVVLDPFKLD